MARLIQKSGYIKNGKASGYMEYVATRDGVEIIQSTEPVTKKQEQFIKRLLKDFPDAKELFEYGDYLQMPNRGTASAFIATVLDLQRRQSGFGFFEAAAQVGMGGAVGFLGHGIGCVFFNTEAQHFGNGSQFLFQRPNVFADEIRIHKHPLGIAQPGNNDLPVRKIRPKGRQEQFFQPFFGQMGRFAFVFPLEFAVALPDDPAVTVGGVPGLGTENPAAVATEDLPGEGAGLTMPIAAVFAPLQLHLNLFPFPRLDNGRMVVLHIIPRNLAFVDLVFLGEEIHRKGLLKDGIAHIFFIFENAADGSQFPSLTLPRRGHAIVHQNPTNIRAAFSGQRIVHHAIKAAPSTDGQPGNTVIRVYPGKNQSGWCRIYSAK